MRNTIPEAIFIMYTEKKRKLIIRVGALALAGLMLLSAFSAVIFS